MLPKFHIVLGAIASLIIYLIYPITLLQALTIFLSSVLIDVDHYLTHALKYKTLSLKKAKNYFLKRRNKWITLTSNEKQKIKRHLLIFHGIEFIAILLVLSFYNPIFKFILIGILIHLFLDYLDLIHYNDKIYSKFSQVYTQIKNKNKISLNLLSTSNNNQSTK
jgi:hypothetical protein